MTDLFIWFNRTQLPDGYIPIEDIIFKNDFDIKKPKFMPEQPWKMYDAQIHGAPPEKEKEFPKKMYLVSTKKNNQKVKFDFYGIDDSVILVSSKFMSFILENGIDESYYEIAQLFVIDTNGNSLIDDDYYALRFVKFDDDKIDFGLETKKRAAGLKNYFLFPDMKLLSPSPNKNVFYVSQLCYRNSLIFTESIVKHILENFYFPQLYNVKDFPFIFNNKRNWDILPLKNEYLVNG
jgi:hypothetical protein